MPPNLQAGSVLMRQELLYILLHKATFTLNTNAWMQLNFQIPHNPFFMTFYCIITYYKETCFLWENN